MAKRPIGIAAAAGQDRLHRLGRFDPPPRLGGRAGARRVVAAHDRCERFDCRGVPVQAGGMGGHLPDGGGGLTLGACLERYRLPPEDSPLPTSPLASIACTT